MLRGAGVIILRRVAALPMFAANGVRPTRTWPRWDITVLRGWAESDHSNRGYRWWKRTHRPAHEGCEVVDRGAYMCGRFVRFSSWADLRRTMTLLSPSDISP